MSPVQSSLETTLPSPANQATLTLDIAGMKCAGCVKTVETELLRQPGVVAATVNLVTEVATIACEPNTVDPTQLTQALTEAGFPSQLRSAPLPATSLEGASASATAPSSDFAEQRRLELRQQWWRVMGAGMLLVISGLGHLGQWGGVDLPGLSNIWFHGGLATLALLGPGRSILIDGWQGLRHNRPNMNTLVSLGTLTAYLASVVALLIPNLGWECFFDEPVMLIGFILLGRTLEQQARGRATAAFQALIALQPRIARLIQTPTTAPALLAADALQARIEEIPAEQVQVGQWLQVLPGERIPVDGTVLTGQTTVDEAMLTGEALPVTKQPGDSVAAGTLNQSGAIALQATRTGKDTTLAQIIALVEAAQTRKAPIQGLADTVAGYFTYVVLGLAVLTFAFWDLVGTLLWPQVLHPHALSVEHAAHHLMATTSPELLSLKLAIAVLVVACPCALGLATPTAILVGSSLGAEQGLLIRGGDVLEKVHHLDTVVFDKTGTLTTGQPRVTDCLPWGSLTAADLLQIAATVESGTRHPLAIAIQQAAQAQALSLLPAEHFRTEAGLGVAAVVEQRSVVLGTADWLIQHGIPLDAAAKTQAEALNQAGKTVVYVAVGGEMAGLIAVSDQLRNDAATTVAQLRQAGLRVMLLTGDRQAVAMSLAQPLGLQPAEIVADVRPGGKAEMITQLQAEGRCVAMVGDGINDAPALAQANVGISLHSATDVAIETSDIVLMQDRLIDVVKSIQLSRATFNKIRQNLFWAFAYNIVGIPVAAGVLLPTLGLALSPAIAALMMAFSSVSVVVNSLLLRHTWNWKTLRQG